MKIIVSNRVVIQGEIDRVLAREISARFPHGAEFNGETLSLGRAAAEYVRRKFPEAEISDLRQYASLACAPDAKFPPRREKFNLDMLDNDTGGFFFLPRNAFRRGIPNLIRNIAHQTKEKCAVVFVGSLIEKDDFVNWCENMFPDWETYTCFEPEKSGVVFFLGDFPNDSEMETAGFARYVFAVLPPSPDNYSRAKKLSEYFGGIVVNSAISAPIDYFPVATPFIDAARYLYDDDDKKRRLNTRETIFNMMADQERNDILIAQINNTRAVSNLFLTKYISHCNELLRPLEYLNPIVYPPAEYSTERERAEIAAKICAPEIELNGLNVFMTYSDAETFGEKIPKFDNCYFLTPVSGAVAMRATKYVRKSRGDFSGVKIYDFTDLRIREISALAKRRRTLFDKSIWTRMHSMQKKYL